MGVSCHLDCITCNDEEGLQQFRGGEWVVLRVDPEWVDSSQCGQVTPMGPVVWAQPDDYGVPLLLEALQKEQNVVALRALGTPLLAVFSGGDPLLSQGGGYL